VDRRRARDRRPCRLRRAIFLGGGEQGPFVAISKFGGRRYRNHYQDDLVKPPNENELL
jgi:hypothetical protein